MMTTVCGRSIKVDTSARPPRRSPAFLVAGLIGLLAVPLATRAEPVLVVPDWHHDTSPPLRDIAAPPPTPTEVPPLPKTEPSEPTGGGAANAMLQTTSIGPLGAVVRHSFDGVGDGFTGPLGWTFTPALIPSDANGAVGAYEYVQWVNGAMAVFDKETHATLLGPLGAASFWKDFGGLCETGRQVDPIVRYDQLEDRWVMAQLAYHAIPGMVPQPPFYQCVAVSTSPDPTDSYHRYAFEFDSLADYPKLGVWTGAYYLSLNFNSSVSLACAVEKSRVLIGEAATMQCLTDSQFFLLAADLDGRQPPPSSDGYFAWLPPSDNPVIKQMHVNFSNPNDPNNPTAFLPYGSIMGTMNAHRTCYAPGSSGLNCVAQPSPGENLDAASDRLMDRLAYRKFPDHQTIVMNRSVKVENELGERSGFQWYEIRKTTGPLTAFQQGTYSPDAQHRWMGSAAMDRLGNIAIGYSLSSSTVAPSIYFTGRSAADPLNLLRDENQDAAVHGGGPQIRLAPTNQPQRWGDYTSMAVDPVFDCEFWYTNQYLPSAGYRNWKTNVTSFRFPDCIECVGDCNLSGDVSISEIQRTCNIALGTQPKTSCLQADGDINRAVQVDDIIKAVGNYKQACVQRPVPTPTPGQGAGGGAAGGGGAASTPSELEIWPVSGEQGENVWFLVVLDSDAEVSGIDFEVVYPDDVLTPPVCTKISNQVPSGHSVQSSYPEPGHERVLLVDLNAYPGPAMTNGALLQCTTQILEDAPVGTHTIGGEEQTLSDGYGNKIDSVFTGATFTVYEEGGGPGGCSTKRGGSGRLPIEYVLVLLPWLKSRVRRFRGHLRTVVLAAALVPGLLGLGAGKSSAQESFDAAGRWVVTGEAAAVESEEAPRIWQIRDVQWADRRTVTGRVAVVGVEFMSVGRFEARVVDAQTLSGVIVDREGNQIGAFEVEVTGTGLSGRFVGDSGEEGELSWKAPDPQRLGALLRFAAQD